MFLVPESDDPQAVEVRRLVVRPGDRIVVRLDHEPSEAEFKDVEHGLRRAFEGLEFTPPVIVLSPGMEIGVIGPEADGDAGGKVALEFGDEAAEEFIRWLRAEVRKCGRGSVQRVLGAP